MLQKLAGPGSVTPNDAASRIHYENMPMHIKRFFSFKNCKFSDENF